MGAQCKVGESGSLNMVPPEQFMEANHLESALKPNR